jgi:hypothetical protein
MATWHKLGYCACRTGHARLSRSKAAGRLAVITKSQLPSSSSSRVLCTVSFRSNLITCWSRTNSLYQSGQACANGSPPGGSTLTTCAPNSPNREAAKGPGRLIPRFITLIPFSEQLSWFWSGFLVSIISNLPVGFIVKTVAALRHPTMHI